MRSSRKWPPEMWQWTCSDIRPRTLFHSATTSSRCSRLYHPCSCARLMVWDTASVRLAVTSLCVSVYVRGSTPWPCCLPLSSSTPRNSTFSFDASKIAGPNSLAVYTYTYTIDQRRPQKNKIEFPIKRSIRGIYRGGQHVPARRIASAARPGAAAGTRPRRRRRGAAASAGRSGAGTW